MLILYLFENKISAITTKKFRVQIKFKADVC